MDKSILVIAAHPDDEVLGCGGAMARHVSEGDKVHVLYMTDGVGARSTSDSDQSIARKNAASRACSVLGVSGFEVLNFPDNEMDKVSLLEVVKAIEVRIARILPDTIYTHHVGDLNIDHRLTHQAVITACRPQPSFCVKKIYSFEVASSTEWNITSNLPFIPNRFVDIKDFVEKKNMALAAYDGEMRLYPHSRSIEAVENQNKFRGASVGLHSAEAFFVVREIL